MSRLSRFGGRRAFTLIELLVVVAIISMLLAILLPSLGRAREQAKTVKCGAHLKGIGAGVQICMLENRDYGPSWDDGEESFGYVMYTWVDVLFDLNYLGDYMAGICPTDNRPDGVTEDRVLLGGWDYYFNEHPGQGEEAKPGVRTSYALNNIMHFNYKPDRWTQDTSKQVYAMDGWWCWFGSLNAAWLWKVTEFGGGTIPDSFRWPDLYGTMVGWRHGYAGEFQSNTLFMDGHVDLLTARPKPTLQQLQARPPGAFDTTRAFTWLPGERPARDFRRPYNGLFEEFKEPQRKPFRALVNDGLVAYEWIGTPGSDMNNVHPADYPKELSALYRTQRNLWQKLPSDPRNRN